MHNLMIVNLMEKTKIEN